MTEEEYIEYFDNTDFGDLIESGDVIPVNFRLVKQDRPVSIRLSTDLINILKKAAKKHKTKYQKLIRAILEENIVKYL